MMTYQKLKELKYEEQEDFEVCLICNPEGFSEDDTPEEDAELQETWIRQDKNFTNTSVISIFKKVRDNEAYNKQIAEEKAKA